MLYTKKRFKLTIIGLLLILVFSQSTYAAASGNQYYKVEKGDTLYKISGQFGVTVQKLMELNRIRDPKLLQIGQALKLPKSINVITNTNATTNTYGKTYENPYASLYANTSVNNKQQAAQSLDYEVRAGDTLYKIANRFGVTLEHLILSNQIRNPNFLQIGQKLKISSDGFRAVKAVGGQEYPIEKVLTATLTAYTAGFESTGKTSSHPEYGITYSGKKVQEGRTIAVDPSVIPLGSTVYIEGVGLRTAEDIGSAIKGVKIDVFIEDLEEALEFGVKKDVKVYVLSD
jgi:LysM repeat protein